MVRAIVFGVIIAALAGPKWATAGEASQEDLNDLTGVYSCEGTNPGGKSYTGIVEILKTQGTYLVRWTMANNTQVIGVGIVSNGVLAVSYFGGAPAVVVYAPTTAGGLDGKWTMGGAEGMVFTETLTKMPEGKQRQPAKRPSPPRRRVLI